MTPLPRNMPGCGLWVFAQCGRDAAGARLARGCGGASSAALSGGAHVARGSPVRALWLHARVLCGCWCGCCLADSEFFAVWPVSF